MDSERVSVAFVGKGKVKSQQSGVARNSHVMRDGTVIASPSITLRINSAQQSLSSAEIAASPKPVLPAPCRRHR
jgi:hypothetical protein